MGKDFKFRLHHHKIARAVAVKLHFSVEKDALARMEHFIPFQVNGVEPLAANQLAGLRATVIRSGKVVDVDAVARTRQPAGKNFDKDGGRLAGEKIANTHQLLPVLITKWGIVEQVFDGANRPCGEGFSPSRADSLYVFNLGV